MRNWAEEYVRRLYVSSQLGANGTATYMPNSRGPTGELPWYMRERPLNNQNTQVATPVNKRFELSGEFK